jgi:hypothetical protein
MGCPSTRFCQILSPSASYGTIVFNWRQSQGHATPPIYSTEPDASPLRLPFVKSHECRESLLEFTNNMDVRWSMIVEIDPNIETAPPQNSWHCFNCRRVRYSETLSGVFGPNGNTQGVVAKKWSYLSSIRVQVALKLRCSNADTVSRRERMRLITRRRFGALLGMVAASGTLRQLHAQGKVEAKATAGTTASVNRETASPETVWANLMAGNKRYVTGRLQSAT